MLRSFVSFVLISAALLGSAAAEGDPLRGEAAYAEACVECHASAARIVRRIRGATTEEKQTWLLKFLPEHFASEQAQRADIIAFLLAR